MSFVLLKELQVLFLETNRHVSQLKHIKVIPVKKIRSIDFFQTLSNPKDVIKKGGARPRLRAIANQTYHP